MIINNVDINNFKATLLSKDIQNSEIITYKDWLRNGFDPIINAQEERYIDIKTKLLVEGDTEEEVLVLLSTIISKSKTCTLKFDDIPFFFNCTLDNHSNSKVIKTTYELELQFKSGHKYKPQVTEPMNRILTKTINVPGNLETPCIVEVTPSVDAIDLTIVGLDDDPIIIKNLKQNKKIIINGEDGTVLQDGINKYGDTDMWDFPSLKPGSNTITLSKNTMDVNIKYKGRWI
ncbi:phage distal tail protein [Clostridium algidicarnis]|uniref:phage distal tail protein n=1 Tax=Clostridium algidicarnis TaxID=37659 RepID=UPI003FD8C35A